MEIKITQNLYLLDTPGIIPISDDSEIDQGIKGVINPEKIQDKEAVVQALLELYITPNKILDYFGIDEEFIHEKIQGDPDIFVRDYLKSEGRQIFNYSDFEQLLRLIGLKRGQLNPGGGINENKVLTTIIHAWQKNKIKYYTLPPMFDAKS
jgi:ribosome biogenesis GTPase A